MNRRSWQVLIAAIIGFAILAGLGAWQLQRLAGKQTQIRQMEERRMQSPVSLAEAVNLAETTGDVDYLPIAVRGRFAQDKEILMLTTFEGNAGLAGHHALRERQGYCRPRRSRCDPGQIARCA